MLVWGWGGVGGGGIVDIGGKQMGNGRLDTGTKKSALGLAVGDAIGELVKGGGVGCGG
jgi:hypothetical protein